MVSIESTDSLAPSGATCSFRPDAAEISITRDYYGHSSPNGALFVDEGNSPWFLYHSVGFATNWQSESRFLGFLYFATERIRSINLGSSGSKPDLGKRGVKVAQFLSRANTLRKSGSDSSTRPMFARATACQ